MSGRIPLMAANWKMHFAVAEAVALVEELKRGISRFGDREVVVAPPFTALAGVASALTGTKSWPNILAKNVLTGEF